MALGGQGSFLELGLSFRGQRVRRWKEGRVAPQAKGEQASVVPRATVRPRSHCWAEVAED